MSSSSSNDPASAPSVASGVVRIDPTGLTDAGKKFTDLETKVGGILNNLMSSINGLGEPWGNDSTGRNFTEGDNGYFAARDGITANPDGALPQYQTLFTSYGADLVKAALAHEQHDDTLAQDYLNAMNTTGSKATRPTRAS